MKYLFIAAIAIVAIALSIVNWWLSSIAANNGVFVFNDMTALIGVNQVLTVVASSAAVWLWTQKQRSWSAIAVIVVLGCTITDMHYTIKRVGSMSDTGVETARGHNTQIARKLIRVETLEAEIKDQMKIEARECRNYKPGISDKRRWPLCLTARGLLDGHRAELVEVRDGLAALGARRVEDSAAERVSAAFGGAFTPDQYRKALPVITATALSLGCSLLFAMVTIMAMAGQVASARIIDVTPNEAYSALSEHGALSNRECAKRAGISETKCSRQIKKLCQDGLATSEQRGRQKVIKLVA